MDTVEDRDFLAWASQAALTDQTVGVLKDQGFTSLSMLRLLTPQDIKESFQVTRVLPLAQCLSLKRAIALIKVNNNEESEYFYDASDNNAGESATKSQPVSQSLPSRGACMCVGDAIRSTQLSCSNDVGFPKGNKFRLLLLGKTGAGKSKTGNTILGDDIFTHAMTFNSVTSACELKRSTRNDLAIELMDAPGLFDTGKTHEEISTIIIQSVACMHPGPHAILYVIKLGRYTEEEYGVYQRLKALFDDTLTKYMVVVFTGGDSLEGQEKDIDDILASAPDTLKQVLRDVNNRYVVFNNMAEHKDPQVEQLLDIVRNVVAQNNYLPYSCPKYGAIGQEMEAEVARRLAEVEKKELDSKRYVQELQKRIKMAEEAVAKESEEFEAREMKRRERLRAIEEESEAEIERLKEMMKQQQLSLEQQQEEEKSLRVRLEAEREEFLKEMESQRERNRQAIREKQQALKELEDIFAENQNEDLEDIPSVEEETWNLKSQIAKKEVSTFFHKIALTLEKAGKFVEDVLHIFL